MKNLFAFIRLVFMWGIAILIASKTSNDNENTSLISYVFVAIGCIVLFVNPFSIHSKHPRYKRAYNGKHRNNY